MADVIDTGYNIDHEIQAIWITAKGQDSSLEWYLGFLPDCIVKMMKELVRIQVASSQLMSILGSPYSGVGRTGRGVVDTDRFIIMPPIVARVIYTAIISATQTPYRVARLLHSVTAQPLDWALSAVRDY